MATWNTRGLRGSELEDIINRTNERYAEKKYRPDRFKKAYGLKSQLLHARRMVFPELTGPLSHLSGKAFEAPLPEPFSRILKEEG